MSVKKADVVLVGGGVMSATLGMMLQQLDPSMKIVMVERLDHVAHESTDGWNNAGTGHAGYCELNYTPEMPDGRVEIDRALSINAAFEMSLQFWSYLVNEKILPAPQKFINPTPHQSFVWGEANVAFLRKRYELLSAHHLFKDMRYSEDPKVIEEWMPLVMRGRDGTGPVAATRVEYGSDVDFGSLTRSMVTCLQQSPNFELLLNNRVKRIERYDDQSWKVRVKDRITGTSLSIKAAFVFLGAGGGALPLLQKSAITESEGYGGFPVSGQWLVCRKPDVVQQHASKVYGKAAVGAPPMSVPHLDTRIINGEKALLFGPFAGFTTKFLKEGSAFDLFASVRGKNLVPMMSVGVHNMDLTKYLIGEAMQSHEDRMASLKDYFPSADPQDWTLAKAGQRVQIIKKNADGSGKLEFGTELVASRDGTLAALLGASPGASIAVHAMLGVLERCFKERLASEAWQARLKAMMPSFGQSLIENPDLLQSVRTATLKTLKLTD